MKKTNNYFLALIICMASIGVTQAQIIDQPQLDDFAWLAGSWVGDGFGGNSEEVWTAPSAGSMIGAYKHYKDGKVNFYEILHISKTDGKFSLKLKHFNPDLTGWEDKDKYVEFPFVSATPSRIEFKGLIYELVAEDKMEIRLRLKRGDEVNTEVFHFQRIKN